MRVGGYSKRQPATPHKHIELFIQCMRSTKRYCKITIFYVKKLSDFYFLSCFQVFGVWLIRCEISITLHYHEEFSTMEK